MEEARGVSELLKTGWKPKRTMVYAAWDGEEQGLLGSTEWVETHAELLQKNAAVYVNSDSNSRGFLGMAGSHSLEKFINEVSRDVIDPQKKISVFERAQAARIVTGSVEERKETRERSDLRIGALGSGSDYTPFLQHLGVASLNLGYSGEGAGGSYHSVYDSLDHYKRFGDPNFDYGIALAQTAGRVMLRLANAEVLPFEFLGVADSVGRYVKEITKLSDDMRQQTAEKNRQIREGTLAAYFDPEQTPRRAQAKTRSSRLDVQAFAGRRCEASSKFQAFLRSNEPNGGWPVARFQSLSRKGWTRFCSAARGHSHAPAASRNDPGSSTRSMPPDSTLAMASRLFLRFVKRLSNAIGSRRANRSRWLRKRSIASAARSIVPRRSSRASFGAERTLGSCRREEAVIA